MRLVEAWGYGPDPVVVHPAVVTVEGGRGGQETDENTADEYVVNAHIFR